MNIEQFKREHLISAHPASHGREKEILGASRAASMDPCSQGVADLSSRRSCATLAAKAKKEA